MIIEYKSEQESSGNLSSSAIVGVVIAVVVVVIIVVATITSVTALILKRHGVKCTKSSSTMYAIRTVFLNLFDCHSEVYQRKETSRQVTMKPMWQ